MNRSRATRYRQWPVLLLALTVLAGCHRAPAPAPSAAAEEPLQRRLSAEAQPAPLPAQVAEKAETAPAPRVAEKPTDLLQPSSIDPKPRDATNERPGLPIPPEPVSSSADAETVKTAAPASDGQQTEFSISSEDRSPTKEAAPPPAEAAAPSTPVPPPLLKVAPQAQVTSVEKAPVQATPVVQPLKEAATPQQMVAEPPKADPLPPPKQTESKAEPMPAAEEAAEAESQLPWGPSSPSPEMAAIAKQAEETARHGFDLAERGALYTARARFIESLRAIAQAIDSQRGISAHSRALAAGLRAMEEVDDFVPRGTNLESDLNLKLIVDAHRTPVLKERPLENVTVTEAQRLYLTYAQEQLAAACGDQAVASLALHGLGKVCAAPSAMHGPQEKLAECKAVVFYQAAIMVEPRNFLAANELGVLLARFGRLDDACKVLEQAVAVSNAPTTWRNLATVYDRLGNAQRAQQARQQAETAVAQLQHQGFAKAGMRYPIDWLDPESFARTNSMVGNTRSVVTPQPMTSAAPATPATAPQQQPSAVPQTASNPDRKPSNWWGLR